MEFLNRVLGIKVIYKTEVPTSLPNFIYSRYKIQRVMLDGLSTLFIYPKDDINDISAIKTHLEIITKAEGSPAVLVLNHLMYRQKEYLLRDHIPFIVNNKQIYLPFMALYLQERCDAEKQDTSKMLPSAQLLLLFYIYHGCGNMLASEAGQKLGFTPTSISRASKQLQEMGLIKTEKRGVQKIIYSNKTPKQLFETAKKSMCNPVKRTIYVPKNNINDSLLLSGYSALSEYSMINPSQPQYYATDSIAMFEKMSSKNLQSTDYQCAVELWRYDPRKISAGKSVDKLSLVLSLTKDKDERIEEAKEEILTNVWEELNDKGN